MASFIDESVMTGLPAKSEAPGAAPATRYIDESVMTGIPSKPSRSPKAFMADVRDTATAGVTQLGQEATAATNMLVGLPGGVAGVGMDMLSRISDLVRGVGAKQAGLNARGVADQVNADWRKVTDALGLSKDATGSKLESALNAGMELSDVGGAKLEAATGGVVSKETVQSVRDAVLNGLGLRGTLALPKPKGSVSMEALTADQAIRESAARVAKEKLAKTQADAEARAAEVAAGTAKAEQVAALVKEAQQNLHPLAQAWSAKKAERSPATSPAWDRMVQNLVEPESVPTLAARMAEKPFDPRFPPEEGVVKTRLEEPVIIGEPPDLAATGIDNLRQGKLISSAQANAIRKLTPLPAQGVIVGENGKPYFERGQADPALLKVLGLMGLGAVAGTAVYNWFQSGRPLQEDNGREISLGLAGLGMAGALRGREGGVPEALARTAAAAPAETPVKVPAPTRVAPELLQAAGLAGGGALVGAALSDDKQNGAIVGGLAGLGARALGTRPVDAALGRITTRLAEIMPELRRGIREMELAASKATSRASDAITAFTTPIKKLPLADQLALDTAYVQADGPGLRALVARDPALAEGYQRVREFLSTAEDSLLSLGRFKKGLPDYLPLLVKDYPGLMATLDLPVREGLQRALHNAEIKVQHEQQRGLNELEKSIVTNDYLLREPSTSYQPGFAKERRLKVTDETRPFYHTLEDALVHYAHEAVSDVETAAFFGKDLKATEGPNGGKFTNIEGSIGNLVRRGMEEGKLTVEQAAEVRDMLQARFIGGEKAPVPWLQDVRNVTGAALLGQIGSGLVQTSEGLLSMYHHGVGPALAAVGEQLAGRGIKPSEFGLANHLIEEVVGKRMTGQVLSKLLKANLLATFDQIGVGQNLTASFLKNKALVKTPEGVAKLAAKWAVDYGPDFPRLVEELQKSETKARTPLVDSLLYQELSDTRPTSRAEAPELFNAHPNARLAYHLKQFMLSQADILRRDAYNKIRTGDPKQVAEGFKNLALYATALSVVTVPADAIKNWIMGRGLQLNKIDYVENFVRNFGLSRYTMDKVSHSQAPGKTMVEALSSIATPPAVSVAKTVAEGLSAPKKLVPFIPVGGRIYYNRKLGGNEAAAKQQAIQARIDARDAAEQRDPSLKANRLLRERLRKERELQKYAPSGN